MINISVCLLEVSGEESFVKEIYNDFKIILKDTNYDKSNTNDSKNKDKNTNENKNERKPKQQINKEAPKLLSDLNLIPQDGKQSLKDFIKNYNSNSSEELNLFYSYYLKKILKIDNVTIDHIFSCYKHTGKKPPTNLYQTLVNTKNRKGWLNINNINDIKVTINGDNYVEFDFKEKTNKSKVLVKK